ncbi:MAG: PhoH family protein [Gammaproteobacteria bacterium]|nr:PhoH family protein [Gammaproteobacteria bacterium]
MKATDYSQVLVLTPENNKRLLNLCGINDENLHTLSERLGVTIKQRAFTFAISGDVNAVKNACEALTELYDITQKDRPLTPKQIHIYLQSFKANPTLHAASDHSFTEIRTKRSVIRARGENQKHFLQQIADHDINFGIGPAGTGKTYLTVACAVQALESGRVSRIILVRPIVEAGEKLGFLPGDLAQKVHPYLQPLYDALYEMLGFDEVGQLIHKGVIELVPLAYMRGRSLNDSFIILDEGQNTTTEQMKMFLTRLGFNSKAVITGDITQIDLNNHRDSGLIHTIEVLKGVEGISFTHFLTSDVVRHPLVQSVVEAYEKHNNIVKGSKK